MPSIGLREIIALNKTPENPLPFYAELHRRFPTLVRMSMPFGLNFVLSFRPEHVAAIERDKDEAPHACLLSKLLLALL